MTTIAQPEEPKPPQLNRYSQLIEKIFLDRYKEGATSIDFTRDDIQANATALGIELPKNIGDVLYSFRFRVALPKKILATQPADRAWVIQLAGRALYRFRLAKAGRIVPNPNLVKIKIPDSTPGIIERYRLDDEQALLAKVRYNRLIDIFLGLTTYSLQNHLRSTVPGLGQIEIDELYVGLDKHGSHYVIPVQAKGGKDQISIVQTEQDIAWCLKKYPHMRCRAISAQFVSVDEIALFELQVDSELLELKIAEERHYKLVPSGDLDDAQIFTYK